MDLKYFIIVIVFILLFFIFRWNHKKKLNKKIQEKKKQDLINQKRREKLKKIKAKEDFELSLQKEVKCEDGKIRIYSDSMLGILTDYPKAINMFTSSNLSNFYFSDSDDNILKTNEIIVNNGDLEKMNIDTHIKAHKSSKYDGYMRKHLQFDLKIITEDWFSEKGEKMNFEEVVNAKKNWHNLNNDYKSKYRTLMTIIKFSRSLSDQIELVMINDFVFIKNTFRPFYGIIDNVLYKYGKKIS